MFSQPQKLLKLLKIISLVLELLFKHKTAPKYLKYEKLFIFVYIVLAFTYVKIVKKDFNKTNQKWQNCKRFIIRIMLWWHFWTWTLSFWPEYYCMNNYLFNLFSSKFILLFKFFIFYSIFHIKNIKLQIFLIFYI